MTVQEQNDRTRFMEIMGNADEWASIGAIGERK